MNVTGQTRKHTDAHKHTTYRAKPLGQGMVLLYNCLDL